MNKREFRQLICSMLLGDGHLTEEKYIMNHSNAQKDYASWKAELINSIFREKNLDRRCTFGKTEKYDPIYDKTYYGVRVQLSWTKYFRLLKPRCYRIIGGKPIKNVEYLLRNINSDLHISIWLCDDGSEKRHKNPRGTRHIRKYINPFYEICCYSFTEGQCQLAKQYFENKYQVQPRIVYDACRGKNGYKLRFTCPDSQKLFQHIRPYLEQVPSMKQKFWLSFERYLPNNEENPNLGDDIVQTTTQ